MKCYFYNIIFVVKESSKEDSICILLDSKLQEDEIDDKVLDDIAHFIESKHDYSNVCVISCKFIEEKDILV